MSATTKNNVLIIGFSFSMGGTQRMMVNYINELSDRKIPVFLYIYNYSKNQILEEQLDKSNINLITCGKRGLTKHFFRLFILLRIIHKHKINKIFSFSLQGAYLAVIARLLLSSTTSILYRMVSVKKAVNQSGSSSITRVKNFLFDNFLLKSCDKIICQSNSMADDLSFLKQKDLANKITVIHNFFDMQKVGTMAVQEIDLNFEFILFVGRLSPEKNIFGIIDAYKSISKSIDEKLVIIGKGNLEEELSAYIKANFLEEKIIMLGNQGNVYKYLARAKCLVLFSVFEGMPNVVLEAMACKTGVIISDFDGYLDIVEDGITGLVVAKNDVNSLSLKMKEMIENEHQRNKIVQNSFHFVVNLNNKSKDSYIALVNL